MLAIERKNEILGRLRNEKRVLVSELAEYYNVTEETIRRDLEKLEIKNVNVFKMIRDKRKNKNGKNQNHKEK